MVRQHDATGTHANALGAAGHMREQHRRGGAGDAWHAVVLGQPVTLVTPLLGVLRQAQGVAIRGSSVAALSDGGEVEN